MESSNNRSFQPLLPNRIYFGAWDDVVKYTTACINFKADTQTTLTVYISQNKQTETVAFTQIIPAGTVFNYNFTIEQSYLYMTLVNTSLTPQTYLSFTVVYKDTFYITPAVAGSNVNIVGDTVGLAKDATLISTQTLLTTKGGFTFWNNTTLASSGSSELLSIGDKQVKNITIYGNSLSPITLTVYFGSAVQQYASQYSIPVEGDFGFNLPCCFTSIKLVASGATTITAECVYC